MWLSPKLDNTLGIAEMSSIEAENSKKIFDSNNIKDFLPDGKILELLADLSKVVNTGIVNIENVPRIDKNFLLSYEKLSEKMGVNPPIKLYASPHGRMAIILTKQGDPVIVLDIDSLEYYPSNEVLAGLAHEIKHYKNGDISVEQMVNRLNSKPDAKTKEELIGNELRADKGAEVLCNPTILADLLRKYQDEQVRDLYIEYYEKQKDSIPTSEELKAIIDAKQKGDGTTRFSAHPGFSTRIEELEKLPKNTAGCIKLPEISSPAIKSEPYESLGNMRLQTFDNTGFWLDDYIGKGK